MRKRKNEQLNNIDSKWGVPVAICINTISIIDTIFCNMRIAILWIIGKYDVTIKLTQNMLLFSIWQSSVE